MFAMAQTITTPPRGLFRCRVLDNRSICLDHYLLSLELDSFPPSCAGQFIQLRCGEVPPILAPTELPWPGGGWPQATGPELLGRQSLLRRPISLAGRRDLPGGKVELLLIYHVVGVGTAWLTQVSIGQELDIIGPLGQGFPAPPDGTAAALVGGGVGIPPMMYLAEQLRRQGRPATAFVGARTRAVLPLTIDPSEPPSQAGWPGLCTAEFAACGVETVVATDDGSLGVTGFVSAALEQWLGQKSPRPEELIIYACGPLGMMKAVSAVAAAGGYRCYVALERHMACGMGACQSCIVKVRTDRRGGWKYALACKDGTVFDAQELVW